MLSRDVDLARFEGAVFGELYLKSQVVCGGTNGIVAGTQFTAAGADFAACAVEAGNVIWLQSADGAIAGAYEIAQVIDSGHLAVSVVRSDETQALVPVAAASGLTWRIVRYAAQAHEIEWEISRRLGLGPGCAGAAHSIEDVTDAEALRQASVFGTLALVFEALVTQAQETELLEVKAAYYRAKFERTMEGAKVTVDTSGDGTGDKCVEGGLIALKRL